MITNTPLGFAVGFMGPFLKSVQPFLINITAGNSTNTATISSVDTANSFIFFNGSETTDAVGVAGNTHTGCTLTNATTVTASRGATTDSASIRGTVVEFYAGFLNSAPQFGSITIVATATSGTATISSVDTAKSAIFFLGHKSTVTNNAPADWSCNTQLTNSTTVTAARSGTTLTTTAFFVVVEFAAKYLKSLQAKVFTVTDTNTTNTDTINSITVGNAIVVFSGQSGNPAATNFRALSSRVNTASTTTVSIVRANGASATRTVAYFVIEFFPGVLRSKQTATINMASSALTNVAISPVNLSKVFINWSGATNNGGGANFDEKYASIAITTAINVAGTKAVAGTNNTTTSTRIIEMN